MAIARPMARLLLAEIKARPFCGELLQLGRQTVLFSAEALCAWARRDRVPLAVSFKGNGHRHCAMDDKAFFSLLGFGGVFSCDVSAYEGADFILDLNTPVPRQLHERFDVIYDGGTMEHIFNVPGVLANIHTMLKSGGRVIHIAPTSNMVDHGFYSFSPTFFSDYYSTNSYELLTLNLFECFSWTGSWDVYDCLSGNIDNRLGRVSTAKMSGVFCIAKKAGNSASLVIPSQGHFSRLWRRTERSAPQEKNLSAFRETIRTCFPRVAEAFYRGRAILWKTVPGRRGAMPPLVGRY